MVRTGATLADAAAEWLRFIEEDRGRKPSTLNDYRSALKAHLLPAFGSQPLESITPQEIDEWRRGRRACPSKQEKLLIHTEAPRWARRPKTSWGILHICRAFAFATGRRLPSEAGGDRG